MSNIAIHLGPQGSQVGGLLIDYLLKDSFSDDQSNSWFTAGSNGESIPNSITIGPENETLESHDSPLHTGSLIATPSVRYSNNWASGFNTTGPSLNSCIVDNLRKCSEQQNSLYGFLSLSEIDNEIGSGLGSYVSVLVKDLYPKKALTSVCTLPYSKSTTSRYNLLLGLSHIYNESDAVILFSPRDLMRHHHCKFDDIYFNIAIQLCCILQCDFQQNMLKYFPLLASHPDLKLLNLQSLPSKFTSRRKASPKSWAALADQMASDLFFNPRFCEIALSDKPPCPMKNRIISSLVCLRNSSSENVTHFFQNQFSCPLKYAAWTHPNNRAFSFQRQCSFFNMQRYCTSGVNNAFFCPMLENELIKSWKSFNASAFTHHYFAEGCSENDFVEAFLVIEKAVNSYKSNCLVE